MISRLHLPLFFICSLFTSHIVFAGGNNETTGARSASLGGASVTHIDVWSTSNNPGALGYLNAFAVGTAFETRHFLPEAGLKSVSAAAPISGGTFGLVAHSFGYAAYNDNRIGLAYARQLADFISVGVQLNYVFTQIGDVYGSRSTVLGELGVLVKPSDKIRAGVHLYNPTRQRLAQFDNERIPTVLSIGGSYRFSEKVEGSLQVDKDMDLPINVRSGVEYEPVDRLFIRAGYATLFGSLSFGLGFEWNKIVAEVASNWDQQLGYGATVSLSAKFGKRKK